MYIIVIGIIKDTRIPKIEAEHIKQSPIRDTDRAKELWKMEVKDFWNFLTSTI